jgi:predicted enzyme related to lactoylglutathione lyase
MAYNPVVWFEIYVSDMNRARAFYETVLGVGLRAMDTPPMDPPMQMLFFPGEPDAGGASGALVKMAGVPVGGGSTLVYFACEDCAVEAGRVAKAGGKVFKEKTSIGPYGHIALLIDTEGNMVGLHSMK